MTYKYGCVYVCMDIKFMIFKAHKRKGLTLNRIYGLNFAEKICRKYLISFLHVNHDNMQNLLCLICKCTALFFLLWSHHTQILCFIYGNQKPCVNSFSWMISKIEILFLLIFFPFFYSLFLIRFGSFQGK
jgi:hypothetical protein